MRVGLGHEKLVRFVLRVIELPAVPTVVALTVTKFVLEVALTPTELPLVPRLIAAARFVARTVGVTGALVVQYGKFTPEVEPSEPPVNVPALQAKPVVIVSVLTIEFPPVPGVLAETVTVLALALAVTVAEVQRLMAAARFAASVVVLPLAAKVPVVVPQAVDPFKPVVGVAQEYWPELVVVPEIETAPSVVAVTVTLLPACEAVAPNAAGHELIALAI
jgi:hypothetical protein